MARLLVVFLLLAAIGVVLLVAWPRGGEEFDAVPGEGTRDGRQAGEYALRDEAADPSLEGRGRKTTSKTKPDWPVIPTDQIPRGGLDVLVYGPDMHVLPPGAARVTLERLGARFYAEPLAREDPETGAHRFRDLPYGKVLVRAYGLHLLPTEKEAEVPLDGTAKVELFADRGGAIHYVAVLADETKPAWVKLELRSGRTGKPVRVNFKTEAKAMHGTARWAEVSTEGPEGFIQAIPPGDYVLHATSAEGAVESISVTIEASKTVELTIPLRF